MEIPSNIQIAIYFIEKTIESYSQYQNCFLVMKNFWYERVTWLLSLAKDYLKIMSKSDIEEVEKIINFFYKQKVYI